MNKILKNCIKSLRNIEFPVIICYILFNYIIYLFYV